MEWLLPGCAARRHRRAAHPLYRRAMRTTPIYDELVRGGPVALSTGDDGTRPAVPTAHARVGGVVVHAGTPGRHREPVPEARIRALR